MEVALKERLNILPGLDIVVESNTYNVVDAYRSGWLVVTKDTKDYKIPLMALSTWTKYQAEFMQDMLGLEPDLYWRCLCREMIQSKLAEGFSFVDLVLDVFHSKNAIARYDNIEALRYTPVWQTKPSA